MNINLWSKTLLSAYRYFYRISDAIDNIVESHALNCYNIGGALYTTNNTLDISNTILDLSERKVKLINLKLLVEKILNEMNREESRILIEKYFDKRKCKDISAYNKISMRSVFRKLDEAETSFSYFLEKNGFSDNRLYKYLENEEWIIHIYNNIKDSRNRNDIEIKFENFKKAVNL